MLLFVTYSLSNHPDPRQVTSSTSAQIGVSVCLVKASIWRSDGETGIITAKLADKCVKSVTLNTSPLHLNRNI